MNEDEGYNVRITRLEQQIREMAAYQAKLGQRLTALEDVQLGILSGTVNIRSQAAQTQATEHLYAPLRNDVKAITELSAFARKVANFEMDSFGPMQGWNTLFDLVSEAQRLLKTLQK